MSPALPPQGPGAEDAVVSAWEGSVVSVTPDGIEVLIPAISSDLIFGPARYLAASAPAIGDDCAVIFTDGQPFALIASPTSGGPVYVAPSGDESGVTDTANILSVLSEGRDVGVRGEYWYEPFVFPVSEYGGGKLVGDGPEWSIMHHVGGGYGITFGDGGAIATRYQTIRGVKLVGNGTALGAVRFNGARWCDVVASDVRDYWGASAEAILLDGGAANYFNAIGRPGGEMVDFENNYCHLALRGDTLGTGANSNYVCTHFALASGPWAAIIDGGDNNRFYMGEASDATAVGIKIRATATTGDALGNRIEDWQFDAPLKAWEIDAPSGGRSVYNTQLLWNTGTASMGGATDAGTGTIRHDVLVP